MTNCEELELYCKEQLAYLLDEDDFQLYVFMSDGLFNGPNIGKNKYSIVISNNPNEKSLPIHTNDKLFKWSDVKDYIIPFLTRMDKDYDVDKIYLFRYWREKKKSLKNCWYETSYNRIVNDKLNDEDFIRVIYITIGKKTKDTLLKRLKRFANF